MISKSVLSISNVRVYQYLLRWQQHGKSLVPKAFSLLLIGIERIDLETNRWLMVSKLVLAISEVRVYQYYDGYSVAKAWCFPQLFHAAHGKFRDQSLLVSKSAFAISNVPVYQYYGGYSAAKAWFFQGLFMQLIAVSQQQQQSSATFSTTLIIFTKKSSKKY